MTKNVKKIILISLVVLLGACTIAGAAVGIYFGVATVECVGYVKESGSNSPIANVAVTDGKNVVKTNDEGYFRLKGWHKARFVTITNPSGYWTENYYFEISSKTEQYDFALDKVDVDQTNHTFVHTSDTEVGKDGVGTWVNDIKKVVDEQKSAFVMHTGDICYADGLKSHINGMNTKTMGVPVRYAIGNHDYVGGSDGKYGEQLFEDIYGPVCYSFDIGDIHYIVTPMMTYTEKPAKYSKSDVWRWVENDLKNKADGKKVVMFNHDYCKDENGFEIKYGGNELKLKDEGLIGWFFGHWHYSFANYVDGVLNVCTAKPDTGGVDNSPNAVRSVSISGGVIKETKMHYAYTKGETAKEDYVWQSQIKGRTMFAEPIVVGNRIYVATATDDYPSKSGITCIDIDSGEIIWEFGTINSVRNNFGISGNRLVCQDVEGHVYSINTDSGLENWSVNLGLEYPKNTTKGIVIDGENVYCGSEEKIACLSIADGSSIWQENREGNSSSASRFVVSGDYLLVGSHWDKMVCYNKNSKKLLWSTPNIGFITTTPVVQDGKVILLSDKKIYQFELSSGKKISETVVDGFTFDTASKPLIQDGIGYFATANKGVVAVNMTTYKPVWNFETKKGLIFTSPYSGGESKGVDGTIVEKDGKLYFGALDGYVYCIDKASGTKLWEKNIGSPILTALAFAGDKIVVADFDGRVTLINIG